MKQMEIFSEKALSEAVFCNPVILAGASRSALRQALAETAYFTRISEIVPASQRICAQALEVAAPAMERLCTPPAGDYLAAVYAYLTYSLYPSPEHPPEEPPLAAAICLYLETLRALRARERENRSPDPLTDLFFVTEEEREASPVREEYAAFEEAISSAYYGELMCLAREIMPFDPLSHTAGVHYVAVHMARAAKANGVPVDIALVSAASMSHDIGKFGCRHDDAKRIPYLHYYFTDQWLLKQNLPHIAHIAANHSTWDLEFENLPVESLLLIYADFRVRGSRDASGKETIRIHTLSEAGDLIFGKLSDMVPQKRRRYSRVYHKLCDFEEYLTHLSCNPDPFSTHPLPVFDRNAALLTQSEAVTVLKRMAMEHNIRLMDAVSTADSFTHLLERARSEKNLESIRTYLNLLSEYFTYMTRGHKMQTLNFLYELLMHHESDVRRQAGLLMGRILANSGLQYRKELPEDAPESAIAPTMASTLKECAKLWTTFMEQILEPDHRIMKKHAARIVNSLKVVVDSLFANCKRMDARMYLDPLLARIRSGQDGDRFAMLDSIVHVPAPLFTNEELAFILEYASPLLVDARAENQVCALRCLLYLCRERREDVSGHVKAALEKVHYGKGSAAAFLLDQIDDLLSAGQTSPGEKASGQQMTSADVSELYLDNLKNAVHWMVKEVNIDRLAAYASAVPGDAFHVASHLSNLLMVSEHLPVREHAGRALSTLAQLLSVDQCNEIVIDLSRGLETGRSEFARYVPESLGRLILRLPAMEQDEALEELTRMVRSGNTRSACLALDSLGVVLSGLMSSGEENDRMTGERIRRIMGVLLSGLAHFDDEVHRAAMVTLCRDVFAEEALPLIKRRSMFSGIVKKLLTLLSERRGGEITFFNTAAMLNHLYRMTVDCEVSFGPFLFPKPGPVAFFPGTFDPFSSGHKRIVTEILGLGMEVYLAVDELSWSKRTQPKLLRRQIALMSTSDQPGVYLFPDDLSINLANREDLSRLRNLFEGRKLYLVAGSDVIDNASAYADDTLPGAANTFDHILFSRSREEEERRCRPTGRKLTGQVIELSLPTYYEDVSSSRIREFIDKNLEISMFVDPVVEAYIHKNGLYLRAPQYKQILHLEDLTLTTVTSQDDAVSFALRDTPERFRTGLSETLRSGKGIAVLLTDGNGKAMAGAYGHGVNAAGLLSELGSHVLAEQVRATTSGKILMLDDAYAPDTLEEAVPELVNELLSQSLVLDHTYALYHKRYDADPLWNALPQKGFLPVQGLDGSILSVDMRSPMVITCDAFMMLKEPFRSDPQVKRCVLDARRRLLTALCGLYPGTLLLSFDTGRINSALVKKVQQYNGVLGLPEKPRRLGPFMCVPYGKILSDAVVPNTVTKALHVEKVFQPDVRHFTISEEPGYSPLVSQLRAVRSFNRPVLLVDDLLHNGYRLEKLDPMFKSEQVHIHKILVGVLSGRGKDLMEMQGRDVDTVYLIPNMKYWFGESLMYPFIGGDGLLREGEENTAALPSINLILPYKSPDYLRGCSDAAKRRLSLTALNNAFEILHTLETRQRILFARSLPLGRLGEALSHPRLPDKGRHASYDPAVVASAYVRDDIESLLRLGSMEESAR
jgi:nicotinic acid mononucleotide adenylyltransferase